MLLNEGHRTTITTTSTFNPQPTPPARSTPAVIERSTNKTNPNQSPKKKKGSNRKRRRKRRQ